MLHGAILDIKTADLEKVAPPTLKEIATPH
jgi:hypothetical protein